MKASELRPGQFFELTGAEGDVVRYLLVQHRGNAMFICWLEGDEVEYDWVSNRHYEVNPNVPQCWEGEAKPSFYSWDEPTEAQLHDAAMTMDHGIGLRPAGLPRLMHEAREWLHAWRKVFMDPSYMQKQWEAKPTDQPPQFQPGDWVVCVDDKELSVMRAGNVCKIQAVEGTQLWFHNYDSSYSKWRFRHATPAEIEAAKPKLQLREGGWYRQINGHVVGPCKPYQGEGSESKYKWTMEQAVYLDDGWTDYGPWRIVEEVPDPPDLGPQRGPASVAQIEAQTKAVKRELAVTASSGRETTFTVKHALSSDDCVSNRVVEQSEASGDE